MDTNKPRRKGPPRNFDTLKAAREALTNLADSLSNHSFSWPAAALRSYLKGTSKTLDEAFGLPDRSAKTQAPAKAQAAAKPVAAKKKANASPPKSTKSASRRKGA